MAEADAEHRLAGRRHGPDGAREAAVVQRARRDRERTDAREHDAVAPGDPLGAHR